MFLENEWEWVENLRGVDWGESDDWMMIDLLNHSDVHAAWIPVNNWNYTPLINWNINVVIQYIIDTDRYR